MSIVSMAQIALLAFCALLTFRAKNSIIARYRAIIGLSLVLVLALVYETNLIMLSTIMMGITAVALSPVAKTGPATFARMLLLCGLALMYFELKHPLILFVLWSAPALVVWLELISEQNTKNLSRSFALYHIPSGLLFLLGALLLSTGHEQQACWLIFLAIMIKDAILPLHSWFVPLIERAPMGIVMMFAGPQIGIFAMHQMNSHEQLFLFINMILPAFVVVALLCAGLALAQTEAKRSLGFIILSLNSLAAFGFEQNSHIAQEAGSLLTWQVIGLATTAFAMTLQALFARKDNLSLLAPSGHFSQMPKMASAFLIFGCASVGLPGTLGFVAEDLLFQGSIEQYPLLTFLLIVATALNAISIMRMFYYLFCGNRSSENRGDLSLRESSVLTMIMALLFIFGLVPSLVLN